MTVSLTLPPELEARIEREAARRSLAVEDYLAKVVAAGVPQDESAERRTQAMAALDSIADIGGDEEQRDTFEYLSTALDADRLSDRKLFT